MRGIVANNTLINPVLFKSILSFLAGATVAMIVWVGWIMQMHLQANFVLSVFITKVSERDLARGDMYP